MSFGRMMVEAEEQLKGKRKLKKQRTAKIATAFIEPDDVTF